MVVCTILVTAMVAIPITIPVIILVHEMQDLSGYMFRGDFEASGNMMLAQFSEILRALKGQVVSDAASHKDFFHPWNLAGLLQEVDQSPVAPVEAGTG